MTKIAAYAGSFDPFTNGHFNIATRGLEIADELVIGVLMNSKKKPFFDEEERVRLITQVFVAEKIPKVTVMPFRGLLVDFCKQVGAKTIIRGLRAIADFEAEMGIAHVNRQLCPSIDTIFLMTQPEQSFVSSTNVKELASWGADVSYYVHPIVAEALQKKAQSFKAV